MKGNKSKKKFRKSLIIIGITFVIITIIFSFFNNNISPVIIKMSRAKVESLGYRALNLAISSVITDGIEYSELITIHKDADGRITSLQAKTSKINLLARQMATLSQQNIERMGEQGISIPIGAFTGNPFIAGFGPEIKLRIIPIGAVNCIFKSEFSSAGINQTLHKIYLKIVSNVELVIPTNASISISTEILISECVLIGVVPSTFLQSSNLSDMMDLVPGA